MLTLDLVINPEGWDEIGEQFVPAQTVRLEFEHSLVSLSRWESKWCKPFMTDKEKTFEETLDYIKCMTLTPNVPDEIYGYLSKDDYETIQKYIYAPMTATTFSKSGNNKRSNEVITSELIYYWMIALTIPSEYQYWHLNRLMTLIRVCNVKNQPPKKQKPGDTMAKWHSINEARRRKRP
jgi:hypothetical protein